MNKLMQSLVAVGLIGVSSAASAAFIVDSTGAVELAVPSNNDFQTQLAAEGVTNYWDGAQLLLDGPGKLTVEYFGREAGYTNKFYFNGSMLFNADSTPTGVWVAPVNGGTFNVADGLVPFSFTTNGGSTSQSRTVDNGSNMFGGGIVRSFGLSVTGDNVAWLLWDDSGAQEDDNHDDMVIRLTFTSVPEPATMGLLGLGLLGLGLGARRRKA